jgi:hypothetical protein
VIDDEGLGFADDAYFWKWLLVPTPKPGVESDSTSSPKSGTDPSPESVDAWKNECEKLNEALAAEEYDMTSDQRQLLQTLDLETSKLWLIIKASHWINTGSRLMRLILRTSLKNRCILVVAGETLRTGLIGSHSPPGVKLSKKLSWERTIEDFHRAFDTTPLDDLRELKYIAVRLGVAGALLWKHDKTIKGHSRIKLVYDQQFLEDEFANPVEYGELPGLTTVFTAEITRALCQAMRDADQTRSSENNNPIEEAVDRSLASAMVCCRRYFQVGFGPDQRTIKQIAQLQFPIVQIFGKRRLSDSGPDDPRFAEFILETPPSADWTLLKRYLSRPTVVDSSTRDGNKGVVAHARDLAHNIVLKGSLKSLGEAQFPFTRFNNLLVVERKEIEGLRSIRNLLAEYIHREDRITPISVAVFGPPGSGKSFGVKQIAQTVAGQSRIEEFVFNLAQFSSFEQLGRQLLRVRDAGLKGRLPLVFFDEFDCDFDKQALGWLKFFLAPMQDGEFQHGESMLGLGRSILVFAGGIAGNHEEFNDPMFWKHRSGDAKGRDPFSAAKGPDFHSRLRGFLDIAGVNPNSQSTELSGNSGLPSDERSRSGNLQDWDDCSFIIRRAIVIRQILERRAQTERTILDSEKTANVDRDVLDALLLAQCYKHGIRSIESILDMSALHQQRQVSKTAIPSSSQYLMHVDLSFQHILLREYDKLHPVLRKLLGGE